MGSRRLAVVLHLGQPGERQHLLPAEPTHPE